MSLTREEWEHVWELAKAFERDSDYLYFKNRAVADRIRRNAVQLKRYVEQVIGQME